METLHLYEAPKGIQIECETSDGSTFITFHHLDGMYSYCTTEKGAVVHLYAGAGLKKLKNGTYKLNVKKV